jgi:hypothetical protein
MDIIKSPRKQSPGNISHLARSVYGSTALDKANLTFGNLPAIRVICSVFSSTPLENPASKTKSFKIAKSFQR